jgi:hypothetical protein
VVITLTPSGGLALLRLDLASHRARQLLLVTENDFHDEVLVDCEEETLENSNRCANPSWVFDARARNHPLRTRNLGLFGYSGSTRLCTDKH